MATCIIEDSASLIRFCTTMNTMKQLQSNSIETINQQYQTDSHQNSNENGSNGLLGNHELTRKRRAFNRSITFNDTTELTRIVIDNSCSIQAVSQNNNNNETTTIRIRPTTLSQTDGLKNRPYSFRTCLSHPLTSSSPLYSIDANDSSPMKFTSLPVLTSPPTKRLRPQTLTLTLENSSVPLLTETVSTSFSASETSTKFIDAFELANKLKDPRQLIIFDCGSALRHGENRICNSNLLCVADKISRKRLKKDPTKHLAVDIEQLHECDSIILYDDNTNNHQDLSPGLKCAFGELQRCLTVNNPPIFILKQSFDQFSHLFPSLCEFYSSSKIDSPHSSTAISPNVDFQNYPMTHIIDGLFIGSESNAKNLDELSSERIQHIVNVTPNVPAYHSDHFHYYNIPAEDTQKQNLLDHFDHVYKFIHRAITNNEKVLVHCVAGISRSPAIVISFLMRYAKMTMNDAYEFVKRKRSIVSPNLNFMGQLLQYETKLKEQK